MVGPKNGCTITKVFGGVTPSYKDDAMVFRKPTPAANHIRHIFFLVILLLMQILKPVLPAGIPIEKTMRQYGIIPDIVDYAPRYIINVIYRNDVMMEMGNKVDPANMQWLPKVQWPAEHGVYYTLMMVDPDVPVRKNPSMAQRQHWIVGNIPQNVVRKGEVITGYIGPISPRNSGLHRCTFLLYQQRDRINFTEPRLSANDREGWQRQKFSNRRFAEKYDLQLCGINFFRTGWPIFNVSDKPMFNPFRHHFTRRTIFTTFTFAPPPTTEMNLDVDFDSILKPNPTVKEGNQTRTEEETK